MKKANHIFTRPLYIDRYKWILMSVWTAIIAGLLIWDISDTQTQVKERARTIARANFLKDKAFRFWAASHGGVYVPVDERTPPNPNLAHIRERDIETPSGKQLTLMNPAYMIRQLMEDFSDQYGIPGKMTSLKPLRKENAPDDWEREALLAFERGETECSEFTDIDGEPYLRLMQPMMTKKSCLKCHGHQGYKVGDVRGGIGVSVPMAPLLAEGRRQDIFHISAFGLLWLLGLSGITWGSRKLRGHEYDRDQAVEALRDSEEQLKGILKYSPSVIFLKDTKGRYQFVSQSYEDLFHVTNKEIQGKTDYDIFPEKVARTLQENDRKVIETGSNLMMDEEVPHDDGMHFYLSLKFPVRDAEGNITGVCGVATDITERKQIEEKLQASEKRYRRLVEDVGEGIVSVDPDERVTFANPAMEKLLGIPEGTLIGRKITEFMDEAEAERIVAESDQRRQGKSGSYESYIRRPNGEVRTLIITGSPLFDSNGTFMGTFGIMRDITVRIRAEEAYRKSEALLRSTLESTADGILVVDKKGKVVQTNKRFAQLWRIPWDLLRSGDDDKLLAYVLDQLVDPEAFVKRVQELYQSLDESRDTLHFKNGQTLERYSRPLLLNNQPAGRVWCFRDVTERAHAEQLTRLQRDCSGDLVSASTIPEVLDIFFKKCLEIGEFDSGGIYLFDLDTGGLKLAHHQGLSLEFVEAVSHYPPDSEQYRIAQTETNIYAPVDQLESETLKGLSDEGLRFLSIIPITHEGQHVAVVNLASHLHDTVSERSRNALEAMASQLGAVIARINAEDTLKLSQFSIDHAADMVFWIESNRKITDVNEASCRTLDYSRDELIGMTIHDIDCWYQKDTWGDDWKRLKKDKSHTFESCYRRKDGTRLPVELMSNYIEYGGKEYSCAFARDISDRKRTEAIQSVLLEISEATGTTDTLPELLATICVRLGKLIDTTNFYVALYEEATQCYTFPFMQDEYDDDFSNAPSQPLKGSLTDYVRRTGKPLLLFEEDHEKLIEEGEVELIGTPSKLWMGIPLNTRDRVIGVLGVQSYTDESRYTESDKELLSIVAGSVAMAIERKQSQEAVRKLREAVESSGEVIFMTDRKGIFTYINPEFTRLYGHKAEEVIGLKTPRILKSGQIPPEEYANLWKTLLKGEGVVRRENPNITKDGRLVIMAVSINPVLDEQGRIEGFLSVQRDITEKKRAVEELRERESRLRLLTNQVPATMWTTDCDLRFTSSRGAALQAMGLEQNEVVGYSMSEFLKTSDEDHPTIVAHRQALQGSATAYQFESHGIDFQAYIEPLRDKDERIIGVIGIALDVTERLQAEKALRKSEYKLSDAQRIAHIGSWEIDIINSTISGSDEFYRILGLEPHHEAIPRMVVLERIHPEDLESVKKGVNRAVEQNTQYDTEYRVVRPDGELRQVRSQGRVRRDVDAKSERLFGTLQDITDQKRAEEEKSVLEAQLRRTQRLETIGTLAGGIAHDFNNILTPILGYADMALLNVPERGVARSDIEHVVKAAQRAKELVQHILTFGRQGEHERNPLVIHLIVKEALELLRASLPTTIEMRRNIDSNSGSVMADPTQIHQVVMNLCTNASHAMQETGGTLEVTLSIDHEFKGEHPNMTAQDYIRLSVKDNGHGMDAETMERVFEPFFTTKGVGEGTGLGLSVVHGIVTDHGGDIKVESSPGVGTTFHVYLPRISDTDTARKEAETPTPSGTEHVLLIDDEPEITSMGRELLESLGYRVTTENDSVKALDGIRNHPDEYELIICDQTMPHLTGIDLAARLQDSNREIPFLLISGNVDSLDPATVKVLGISEFMSKPLEILELGLVVRKLIDATKKDRV